MIKECKNHESMCVLTLGGRRRYLQNINSHNTCESSVASDPHGSMPSCSQSHVPGGMLCM